MRARARRELAAFAGGLPATYWWLWTGMLVNRIGGFVVGFLGLYLTERRGLSVAQAGLYVSLYGLGSVVAGPVSGILSDRFGRRAVLLGGLVLGGLGTMCLGFAERHAALAGLALAVGFVGELYRPAVQAAIADVVLPSDRPRAYGLLYWAVNLGFSVGFALGGLLATVSYAALFVGDGATTLAFAAIVWRRVPETRPAHLRHEPASRVLAGAVAPLRDGVYRSFLGLHFVLVLVFFQFQLALPLDMRAHGISAAGYGALLAMNGVVIVLLQPVAARVLVRHDRSRVMSAAAALTGIGFGLNAVARTVPAYAGAIVFWTLGEIANHPVASALVADLAPPELRGRYQGAFALAWACAALVAPATGAAVLGRLGPGALWGGCLALGMAVAFGQLAAGPARRRRLRDAVAPPQAAAAARVP